ncbi:amino acid ABC transporter permease [Mesorhizobium sp.]|uniref:amino acid ABC transporter permease n=1 Tax=Mesorhizobium sp. TaxID=1871066 RepID=UPI0026002BB1|nr:amino acid ABC transporter permease [Mesorhizobium sp.]
MGDMAVTILLAVPYTLALTALAFSLGAALGIPICALRLTKIPLLKPLVGAFILIVRSIPPLVWLFLIYFGLGSGVIQLNAFAAACIGLGLITAVNMAEIYRGSLAAIHHGQWEASTALGMPRWNQLSEIIAPQLARISLPAAATYAIGLLKDSAVASAIGVPELAYAAYHISQQTFRGLDVYAVVALIYIAMSLPIAWVSRTVDKKMRARVAR